MKKAVLIRRAKQSDAPAIASLLAQLGYPESDVAVAREKIKVHKQPGYCMLVSEKAERVIGFIALHWFELGHRKGMMGRITTFCIDENYRSMGFGARLLLAGEKELLRQKCFRIELTSNERRIRAHSFYLKSGYVDEPRRFVKHPGRGD
jgi:N-acetylglutamate synthase-like GNAT family acetyltransferase